MDVRVGKTWVSKNWCFWTVVLEKTLESPLDCKEIQPVHSKGDESWVFTGRTDAKAETPILCPPHAKSWLIGKDSDAGRDWGQEEKGMTEDEMAGWHHRLNGHELSELRELAMDMLWFMGSQRVRHDWVIELNWTELCIYFNKQDENIQPWCTPLSIWNQSVVSCPVVIVASLPAYRFLRRQVRWSGIPELLKNFPQLWWSR